MSSDSIHEWNRFVGSIDPQTCSHSQRAVFALAHSVRQVLTSLETDVACPLMRAEIVRILGQAGQRKKAQSEDRRGGGDPLPPLRLEVPADCINEVRGHWPETQSRVRNLVGYSLPEVLLAPSEGGFEIRCRELPLRRGEWPENWREELPNVLLTHAHQLLTLDETQVLLDTTAHRAPALLNALRQHSVSTLVIYEILFNLLVEGISIRDIETILTTVVRNVQLTKNPEMLTEFVRVSLSPWICRRFGPRPGTLEIFELGEDIAQVLRQGTTHGGDGSFYLAIDETVGLAILNCLRPAAELCRQRPVVVVTEPRVRAYLARLTRSTMRWLPILSWNEVPSGDTVNSLGILRLERPKLRLLTHPEVTDVVEGS